MWKNFIIAAMCIQFARCECDDAQRCGRESLVPSVGNIHQQQHSLKPEYTDNYNVNTARPQTNYLTVPPPVQDGIRKNTPAKPVTTVENTQQQHTSMPEYPDNRNTNSATPQTFTVPPPLQVPSRKTKPKNPSRIYFPDQSVNLQIPSESFDAQLFRVMSMTTKDRNLCFSPLSLQTLLTFVSTLSEGKLLDELTLLLNLPNEPALAAQIYQSLTRAPANGDENNTLVLANKLYYDQSHGLLNNNVRDDVLGNFATEVDSLDFRSPLKAADSINTWIADKTRHLINYIISPDSLHSDTSALLINSLYFKSEWQIKFSTYDTIPQPFFITRDHQVPVDMMYNEDVFRYGEFEELGASVVEIPYKLDDFSMMIILPNEIDGLAEVEKRLSEMSVKVISHRLDRKEVIVKLPQFKIEFDVDLVKPLQQLGLYSLFNADSGISIFNNQQKPLIIDQIKQKTVIDVNEAGTEAAAVTYAKIVPLSITVRIKRFTADHPFIFVIRNSKAIHFMGHVSQF